MVQPGCSLQANLLLKVTSFSPSGTKIVYEKIRNIDGEWIIDVYVMEADGSNKTKLTNEFSAFNVGWSPNGKKIMFGKYYNNNLGDIEIGIMNKDGTQKEILTERGAGLGSEFWTPDSQNILYRKDGNLHMKNIRTQKTVQITNNENVNFVFDARMGPLY